MIGADKWLRFNKTRVWVETGTFHGRAVMDALVAGFKEVRSVEPYKPSYDRCVETFKKDPRVKLYHGLSEDMLPIMLADLHEPVTFWLDGHYTGPGSTLGPLNCPVLKELAVIAAHPVKTHTILIDDMRCWKKELPDIGFGKDEIEKAVLAVNPKYKLSYIDGFVPNDVLVAEIG